MWILRLYFSVSAAQIQCPALYINQALLPNSFYNNFYYIEYSALTIKIFLRALQYVQENKCIYRNTIERCTRSGPKKLTKTYNKGFPNHSTLINYGSS